MTYKVKCKCNHDFQDVTYGKGIRVANPTSKVYPDGVIEVRCTVCNTVHRVSKGGK